MTEPAHFRVVIDGRAFESDDLWDVTRQTLDAYPSVLLFAESHVWLRMAQDHRDAVKRLYSPGDTVYERETTAAATFFRLHEIAEALLDERHREGEAQPWR